MPKTNVGNENPKRYGLGLALFIIGLIVLSPFALYLLIYIACAVTGCTM